MEKSRGNDVILALCRFVVYCLAAKINGSAFLRFLRTNSLMHTCWQYTGIVYMFKCESSQCISGEHYLYPCLVKIPSYRFFLVHRYHYKKYCSLLYSYVWLLSTWHHHIMLTFVGLLYISYVYSIWTLFCNSISG